jgi:hypothetical protein
MYTDVALNLNQYLTEDSSKKKGTMHRWKYIQDLPVGRQLSSFVCWDGHPDFTKDGGEEQGEDPASHVAVSSHSPSQSAPKLENQRGHYELVSN